MFPVPWPNSTQTPLRDSHSIGRNNLCATEQETTREGITCIDSGTNLCLKNISARGQRQSFEIQDFNLHEVLNTCYFQCKKKKRGYMQNSLFDIIYIFWFYFHRCGEEESAFYFPLFKMWWTIMKRAQLNWCSSNLHMKRHCLLAIDKTDLFLSSAV